MKKSLNICKKSLLKVGNLAQLGGTRNYILDSGFARGMRAIEVNTGAGLRFTVLPDRAMDISLADYCGINLSYLTCSGESHPAYFEAEGLGWLRNFAGGLFTTCGLTYFGPPCEDDGETLGLHGRIANIPAKQIADNSCWKEDEYKIEIVGIMEECRLFGTKLRLTRKYSAILGQNHFTIDDSIENFGHNIAPLTILYHFNFGFPFLDSNSKLELSKCKTSPRDNIAKEGILKFKSFGEPVRGFQEQVFYHEMDKDRKLASATLINSKIAGGMAVRISFNPEELPHLTQWKMCGEGEYVMGLEPCNAPCKSRKQLREEGILPFIAPGEIKNFHIKLEILNDLN